MGKHIAILRGINVSGQKKIKMDELAQLFAELGLGNVRTYIQSGNVIFDSPSVNQADIETKIEQKITQYFGFDVPVIVKTQTELETIFSNNPFLIGRSEDITKLHVTFFAEDVNQELIAGVESKNYLPDEYQVIGNRTYLFCPNGYGRTKLTNSFFERKLKVKSTTRNWKTVTRIVEMMRG